MTAAGEPAKISVVSMIDKLNAPSVEGTTTAYSR
jgi:hypothetical protein